MMGPKILGKGRNTSVTFGNNLKITAFNVLGSIHSSPR